MDLAGLMRELAEVFVHCDGAVKIALTPGVQESADALRALTLLAEPWGGDDGGQQQSVAAFMKSKRHGGAQEELTRTLGGLRGAAKVVTRFSSLVRLRAAFAECNHCVEASRCLLQGCELSASDSDGVYRRIDAQAALFDIGRPLARRRSLVIKVSTSACCGEITSLLDEREVEAEVMSDEATTSSSSSSSGGGGGGGGSGEGGSKKKRDHRKTVEQIDLVCWSRPSAACRVTGSPVTLRSATYRVHAMDGARVAEAVRDAFDESLDDVAVARAAAVRVEALLPPAPRQSGRGTVPVKEVLLLERVATQVNTVKRRTTNSNYENGNHGGHPFAPRAQNIALLVVALLSRSPRFFTISMRLPKHSDEFVCGLAAKVLSDALLPYTDGAIPKAASHPQASLFFHSSPSSSAMTHDVVEVDSSDDEFDDDEDDEALSRQATLEVPSTKAKSLQQDTVLVVDDDDDDDDDEGEDSLIDLTDSQPLY